MIKLATSNYKYIDVSDFELNNIDPSYTLNTVSHFLKYYPNISILVGDDTLPDLDKWYKIQTLIDVVDKIYVAQRNINYVRSPFINDLINKQKIEFIRNKELAVSSTEIKANLGNNGYLKNCLDKKVFDYMETLKGN